MSIINFINKYRKQFLINQINKIDLPNFKKSDIVRKNFTFNGKVQGVGFRVEALGMANHLDLVGWVKNKKNGDVELEIEGDTNKVNYMVNYLSSIRRAPLKNLDVLDKEVLNKEKDFKII